MKHTNEIENKANTFNQKKWDPIKAFLQPFVNLVQVPWEMKQGVSSFFSLFPFFLFSLLWVLFLV